MDNLNFSVDKEKCVKCGQCARDCTVKNIKQDEKGYPYAKYNSCLGCQHCLAVCPTGALSVFGKNPDDSASVGNFPTPEQMESLMKSRRSYRQYRHENINPETMEKLKDIMNWVPTGVNFRDLHFTVVEDKDRMADLKGKVYKQLRNMFRFMPAFGHAKDLKKAVMVEKSDVIFRNAPHMIVVSVNKKALCKDTDPTIALSYFELYAQSLGVGTVWCGYATGVLPLCKGVMKELQIPKTHKLAYVMLFGYPAVTYRRCTQPEKYEMTELK